MAVKTKVVFGSLDAEEAEIVAKDVFLGEFDLEEPKESLNKPVVVGYIKTWLRNHSLSEGHTAGASHGTNQGSSVLQSQGESAATRAQFLGEDLVVTTTGSQQGSGLFSGESDSSIRTDSESRSDGVSEALFPILEERPSQTYSLEEQIYKAMALMVNQPSQHAIIKLPKKHTKMVKTPTIQPGYARKERVEKFKEACYRLVDFTKPKQAVERAIEDRRLLLAHNAKEQLKSAVKYPTVFREPKE